MSVIFDSVIRNATIVDGTGSAPFEGDIAVSNGRIAAVGRVDGRGSEEHDAAGRLVTPGFVDIHTHYDGQITWENRLMPSSTHGVTTVVMGNCGVGFAPCKPEHRDMLVQLMEGVEDIPEVVMTEGLPWNWESFPDYLAALSDRQADIDFAAQAPHSAIRVNVMGQRGADREPATAADLEQMSRIVSEAVRHGALGVSSSRSLAHRTRAGKPAPSVEAAEEELHALARGLRDAGSGVFQIIGPVEDHDAAEEMALYRKLTEISCKPLSFTLLQMTMYPEKWREYLDLLSQANAGDGPAIRGQVFPRLVGIVMGLDLSFHPFKFNPSYKAIDHLPMDQRVKAMRDPDLRRRILSEAPEHSNPNFLTLASIDGVLYPMTEFPDYEPLPESRVDALAAARGITPREYIYDALVDSEGATTFMLAGANYADQSLEPQREMLAHDHTLIGLGDGGAHYGMISDGSFPTTLLALWTRDRTRGPRMPIEKAVQMLTRPNALAVGLTDRGLLAPGMKADINVIDHDRLRLHRPIPQWDLPAGGRRLLQKADGYELTMVSGVVTYRNGEHTGALPGRLVRNPQSQG